MPAAKRPRGATVIREDRSWLPQLRLPPRAAVAGLAACAMFFIMVITSPSEVTKESPSLVEPGLVVEAEPSAPAETTATADIAEDEIATPELPWKDQVVGRGDNLSLIFKRAGFSNRDVHDVVSQSDAGKSLERIYPGQTIAFLGDAQGRLSGVRHIKSPLETITYRRSPDGFISEIETRSPETREAWASGTITSSLYLAGQAAGLSQNMIMEMANIFGGVIDFVLDPRKGDTMHLVYEELYLDSEKYKDGDIIAASFTNQGKTFNAYRYEDSDGEVGFYNEEGVSMRKAFLLAPVDFTRISSNFNLRRLHPIYKTTRPHRGTDYAASRGTPVFAAGDGRVIKAGYGKANGNYVVIQHGEQFVTKYLHLHKRKVKQGQRVSQSQVIGTVGATGAATGPHLHYEFLVNGVHRNPRTIHKKLPKAKSLPSQELPRFREAINEASSQLAALRSENKLAMSGSASTQPATN
jgi:murein DD-endopeptidase MepM/ murein hydrolase activator NlpD